MKHNLRNEKRHPFSFFLGIGCSHPYNQISFAVCVIMQTTSSDDATVGVKRPSTGEGLPDPKRPRNASGTGNVS